MVIITSLANDQSLLRTGPTISPPCPPLYFTSSNLPACPSHRPSWLVIGPRGQQQDLPASHQSSRPATSPRVCHQPNGQQAALLAIDPPPVCLPGLPSVRRLTGFPDQPSALLSQPSAPPASQGPTPSQCLSEGPQGLGVGQDGEGGECGSKECEKAVKRGGEGE
jgi:hypothetical protein